MVGGVETGARAGTSIFGGLFAAPLPLPPLGLPPPPPQPVIRAAETRPVKSPAAIRFAKVPFCMKNPLLYI
jgi:hypothetical protein